MHIQLRHALGATLAAALIGAVAAPAAATGIARPAAATPSASPDAVRTVGYYHNGGHREFKSFSFSFGRYPSFHYREYKSYRRPYYNGYNGYNGYHGYPHWKRRYRRHHHAPYILRRVLRGFLR